MNAFDYWLRSENFIPVKFYPYTSIVTNRIWEQSFNYKITEIEKFAQEIKSKAIAMGAQWDNKVVVEIAYKSQMNKDNFVQSNLFVGYKDGGIVIGLAVWLVDAWIKPQNLINEKCN